MGVIIPDEISIDEEDDCRRWSDVADQYVLSFERNIGGIFLTRPQAEERIVPVFDVVNHRRSRNNRRKRNAKNQ